MLWAMQIGSNTHKIKTIPLASIPNISTEVLNAQGHTVEIADPVLCLDEPGTYFFTVSILSTNHFDDTMDFEFAGDAESALNFVREVRYVNDGYGKGLNAAWNVGVGAVDDVKAIVDGLLNMIRHPIDTVSGLGSAAMGLVDYATRVATGKANAFDDVQRFAEAYVENVYAEEAARHGFNYEEIITPKASQMVRTSGKQKLAGGVTTEVALLFVACVKLGEVGKAVEIANATAKIGETKSVAGLTKVGRWGKVLTYGENAERGAARVTQFAVSANKVSNLERMAYLLSPQKISTLTTSRALNSRLHKLLYWLNQEELAGRDVSLALTEAMKGAGADRRIPNLFLDPKIDHAQIIKNYRLAKDLKVFDDANNLTLMRNGRAPWVVTAYGREAIEVDHEIAVSWAKELENSWGNLSYQTQKYNRMRGNNISQSSMTKLEEYKNAGLLPQARINEILIKATGS